MQHKTTRRNSSRIEPLPLEAVVHLPECINEQRCSCKDIVFPREPPWLPGRTLLLSLVGPKAYGLETAAPSFRGVALPPIPYGMREHSDWETSSLSEPFETTVVSLSVFFEMLVSGDALSLGMLFSDPEDRPIFVRQIAPLFAKRALFFSKETPLLLLEQAKVANGLEAIRMAKWAVESVDAKLTSRYQGVKSWPILDEVAFLAEAEAEVHRNLVMCKLPEVIDRVAVDDLYTTIYNQVMFP